MMDDYASGYLEDFLNFLDFVEEQRSIQTQNLADRNNDLLDLEHYIEFEKADGKTRLKLYAKLQDTRKERRKAKDMLQTMEPICLWISENQNSVQKLRNLLGQVRKIERGQASRAYAIRGHILDDVTTLTHIRKDGGGFE